MCEQIDLYSDKDKELLHQLLEKADCLVENFKPGVMAKVNSTAPYLYGVIYVCYRWDCLGKQFTHGILTSSWPVYRDLVRLEVPTASVRPWTWSSKRCAG